MPGPYNAGTIFLQVVPVFGDTMRSIQREAKEANKALGDEMEKGGRDAGKRASDAIGDELVKGQKKHGKDAADEYQGAFAEQWAAGLRKLEREMKPLKIRTASDDAFNELAKIKAEMKALGEVNVGVDIDSKKAYARLLELRSALEALQRDAADINVKVDLDEARKGVDAFVARVEKADPTLKIDVDMKQAERAMGLFERKARDSAKRAANALQREVDGAATKVQRRLAAIGDVDITPDLNTAQMRGQIADLAVELAALAKNKDIEFDVRADAASAYADLLAVNIEANRLDGKHIEATVDIDAKPAIRAMGAFETSTRAQFKRAAESLGDSMDPQIRRVKAELAAIADPSITPDFNTATIRPEIARLSRELKELALNSPDIKVNVDSAKAYTNLLSFNALMSKIDGQQLDVSVDLDTGAAMAQGTLMAAMLGHLDDSGRQAGIGGQQGANAFRAFNGVILAAIVLLPGLIPILGGVAGAMLALIPILGAVGAGIGVAVIGFTGIGSAVQALGAAQDNAAKDSVSSGKKMEGAARSVEDAERALARTRQQAAQSSADAARSVADAQRSASRSIQDALDQQRDAEENLAKAQRDAREAQQNLTEARKAAREELQQAKDDRAGNALDIRQGVVDVFNATVDYNKTMQDGASTNLEKEQAAINLEQARLRLKELRDAQAEMAKEKKDQDKNGIKGTDAYKSAHDALIAALERERDAQRAVGDAAENVRQARVDGARQIADAVRNQQRVEQQNAQSIGDAQRNLSRAQADYQTALTQTGDIGTSSMQKVQTAMGKLGPEGRKFARWLFSLREGFYKFRSAVQEALLPGIREGLQTIIDKYGPAMQNFSVRMARTVGNLVRDAGKNIAKKGPISSFMSAFSEMAPRLLTRFGKAFGHWMNVFAGLFEIILPYADRFSILLLKLADGADKWMQSADGQSFWTKFMDYAMKVLPDVLDFFGHLFQATGNLLKAMAPWGAMIMFIVDGLLQLIDAIPPKLLGVIVSSLIAMAVAFAAVAGALAFAVAGSLVFGAAAASFALPLFLIVAVLGIAIAIFVQFKDEIFAGARWLWKKIKPIFVWIGELIGRVFRGIKKIWNNVLRPVFEAIWTVIKFLWKNVVKPILTLIGWYFKTIFTVLKFYWTHILWPVLDMIFTVLWKLWKAAFKPVFKIIKDTWKDVLETMRWVWRNVLKPVFDYIKDKALPALKNKFEDVVGKIGDIWDGLKKKLAKPVAFVIDSIINGGIIKGFNKIAHFVGSTEIKPLGIPGWAQEYLATGGVFQGPRGRRNSYDGGGVMPGYSPGVDVHHFTSPTGGALHLSGGEAVMRPEWTSAMGEGYVNYMNSLARRGGSGAVRKALRGEQGYAGGGIVALAKGGIFYPLPGAHKSTYPGHDGIDFNVGSGSDDLGMKFYSATSGKVTTTGYSRGYGNAVFVMSPYGELVYGHSLDGSIRVNPGQQVNPGTWLARVGNTGNSSGPHLHFGFPGGTNTAAEALLAGVAPGKVGDPGKAAPHKFHFPGWLIDVAKNPFDAVKNFVSGPISNLMDNIGNNPLTRMVTDVPKHLLGDIKDKVVSILPKPLRAIAKGVKGALDNVVAGAGKVAGAVGDAAGAVGDGIGNVAEGLGFANGGILPHNGTMMYDNGGYLPPGLTSVVNLTGKPEPVFTAEQFDRMGAGAGGAGFTYAPTFLASDLTAADVANDLDFQFRKLRRLSKYER